MMKTIVKHILHDVLDALAPLHCEICDEKINAHMHIHRICDGCLYMFESAPSNEQLLNGLYRQNNSDTYISHVESFFAFHAEAPIQKALYAIKYTYAKRMAKDFGHYVAGLTTFEEIDCFIPVPLHTARKRERGYNQSMAICEGMHAKTNIPISEALKRIRYSITQTKFSSHERTRNVQGIFTVNNAESIRGKHVMLIDDVMTTGSTLEACAQALLESGARSVSALTIATATLPKGIQ